MTAPEPTLRELAAAAESGGTEWRARLFNGVMQVIDTEDDETVAEVAYDADAHWIAAANPAAVLALLDRAEAAEAERDTLTNAARALLRTADRPTRDSATARVNARALDDLRAALRDQS